MVRSLRWHGRGDVRLEDVELDGPLPPDMVEAEVSFCGICGSDVAEFTHGPVAIRVRPHPLTGRVAPLTLGHEFSAVVVEVGAEVRNVKVGDRIAADACWRCGECAACLGGAYNLCRLGGSIGLSSDGAFAERVRIPAYCAVPLPDGVSDRAGALLEPLAVGLHALTRGGARPGDVVAVLGFGPIGAATAAVGRAIGLDIEVCEPNEARRARAVAHGHRVFEVDGSRQGEATRRRFPVVVDATGSTTALPAAIELTARGGTVVVAGVAAAASTVDTSRLVLFERSVRGALGYVHDLPRVGSLIATGKLDVDGLVTRVVTLDQLPGEIERLAASPGGDLKVLVDVRS